MNTRPLIDPELLPLLDFFPPLELSDAVLPGLRATSRRISSAAPGAGEVTMTLRHVVGPTGAPPVEVLVYVPTRCSGSLPCVLHLHGGGFVMGSAVALQPLHRKLAAAAQCMIVAVDYRLSPETRFPGAVEDCYAVLSWLHRDADDLGIDRQFIGVMGESAGGGLAAALALLARDRGEHRLAFQHLVYPMLDDRTCISTDPQPYAGEFLWTAANNRFGWASLLGVPPGSDGVSAYAAPARAADLAGLPPTFIAAAALDLLVDENIDYARRLLRQGVPVELHVYPGCFHAFDLSSDARVSLAARRDGEASLRRALGRP